MRFIEKKGKTFIFEINDNRLAATGKQEREKGHFIRIDRMEMPDEEPVPVYLKDLKFPVILYKEVFKNKDGTAGVRYLASNDETMGSGWFKTLYKKRWSAEVYHESIKQITGIGRSPAHTERMQSNHMFAAIYGYVKLDLAKLNHGYNHFAIKSQIYMASLKKAMELLSAFSMGDNGVLA
jgi:uncharacterized protein YegP (UPF0339 family)